ncbi:MAG: hypothetical protein ABSF91_08150 [Bacteroidota bacterium]|jgi:predicted  nucleic acid-binding Zn-ribbon protein
MRLISKLVKGLVMIPIFIFALPALIILAVVIIILETEEGSLRELILLEVQAYGLGRGFGRFMQKIFIPSYSNNIQGFIIGGAGFLVVTVGLRSLGILPTEVVYVALGVEFTLLLIYGTMTYFSIDESKGLAGEKMVERDSRAAGDKYEALGKTIKELSTHITQLSGRLQAAETKVDQFAQIDSTLKSIYGKLDVIVGEQSALYVNRDYSEKFVAAMKDLNTQFSVLESRLRSTETKFDQFSQLDTSLQAVSRKLEMIAGDQFNLRVRREFERLVSELNQRISTEHR